MEDRFSVCVELRLARLNEKLNSFPNKRLSLIIWTALTSVSKHDIYKVIFGIWYFEQGNILVDTTRYEGFHAFFS